MTVEIRQARLSDRSAIFEFLAAAYAGRAEFKYPDRWHWAFVDNPFRPPGDELPIWVALDRDRVVGQACLMWVPIALTGRSLRGAHGVDLRVLRSHQAGGVGKALAAARRSGCDFIVSFNASPPSFHIYRELGFAQLEPVPTLSVTCPIATSLGAQGSGESDEVAVSQVLALSAETDDLCDRVHRSLAFCVRRSAEYLEWKYLRQPFSRYRLLEARRAGKLCGLALYRSAEPPEASRGVITSLIATPDDRPTLLALIANAIRTLVDLGAPRVILGTNVPEYQRAAEALGFRRTHHDAVPLLWRSSAVQDSAHSPDPGGRWFFDRGDSDCDQVPVSRDDQSPPGTRSNRRV